MGPKDGETTTVFDTKRHPCRPPWMQWEEVAILEFRQQPSFRLEIIQTKDAFCVSVARVQPS